MSHSAQGLKHKIDNHYRVNMLLDNLPVTVYDLLDAVGGWGGCERVWLAGMVMGCRTCWWLVGKGGLRHNLGPSGPAGPLQPTCSCALVLQGSCKVLLC